MKFSIGFILSLLILSIPNYAQVMDMQWYIKNSKGLNGAIVEPNNLPQASDIAAHNAIWSNTLGNNFVIAGISEPLSQSPAGADRIFAIFEDASFYSSRYTNPTSISQYIESNSSNNYFIPFNSSPIVVAAYYSNIYDKDDLPEDIVVENGGDGTFLLSPFNIDQLTDVPILIAHNTIVHGKDITLTILNYKLEENEKLILTYDKIIPISGVDVVNKKVDNPSELKMTAGFFSESPIFEDSRWVFPITLAFTEIGDQTQIQTTSEEIIHVNLRGNKKLNDLAPAEVGQDAEYYAVFDLFKNEVSEGNRLARTIEPILPVRDPNQLLVRDICMDCRSIFFTGGFYNTTKNPATGLAVEIDIPNDIELTSIKLDSSKIYIGSQNVIPKVKFVGRQMIMTWPSNLGIRQNISTYSSKEGKVQFAFCANFAPGLSRSQIIASDLKPKAATSYFKYNLGEADRIPTPLDFNDLTDEYDGIDALLIRRAEDGECAYCREICQTKRTKKDSWWKTPLGLGLLSAAILALLIMILRKVFFPKPKLPQPPSNY